ncbi:UDP-glycosyltransferase 708A6-like [Dendrobium catenatum]|uniref:UDP-glycosyltransferase 708A6-like n=1 Tax=Dendrobium catenatum TaxID=906689 RepID=UPI0009F1DE2F|nr:UDP-glycosyltransferase 708A6-like [Dendrobium catenatum]
MSSGDTKLSQVLLIPSSGMGHLNPIVRLAKALSDRGISISLLTVRPTITAAESSLLSSLPSSLLIDFPLAPFDPSLFPESSDPVTLRWEAIRRSAHLLPSLISTISPPVSSLIIDITIASTFLPVAVAANIPCFVYFVSFASMLALCSVSPFVPHPISTDVKIAGGVLKIPYSSVPPPLRDPNHLFTTQFIENGRALTLVAGFLSHSGSNSVMEAAAAGLKMLAWPRGGDHRVIAASVPRNGLGIWPENWAWEAEERVVAAEEIAVKVREFMADEKLAETAAKLGAAATAAVQEGGTSDQSWRYLITKL